MEKVKEATFSYEIPYCPNCGGIVKPDIVFFGENLPRRFFQMEQEDPDKTDLLICIGTSLEVYPFAALADFPPSNIARILINRHAVGSFGHRENDVILKGDLIEIIHELEDNISWIK